MKITQLEIIKVPPSWVWLRIHTDAGIVGLGEPYLEGHADSVITEVHRLEQVLLGQDPRRTELLWQKMYHAGMGYRGGPVTMSAISGIDIALWDIKGKAAGLPVHELLGGAYRDRVLMYHAAGSPFLPVATSPGQPQQHHTDGDPVGPGAVARHLVNERGFRALKVHLDLGESLRAITRVEAAVDVVAQIRQSVGWDIHVAVDIHNPHPVLGRQVIEQLRPFRPLFVEEPVPLEHLQALRPLLGSTVAIAAGERWMGKWQFREALETGALAVVQPDVAHAGGITECVKIAAMADAAGAHVALHTPLSPIALAASIQIDAAIPNFLVQEHNDVNDTIVAGRTVIGAGYLSDPFVVDPADGCVKVPTGPGLGITADEQGLEAILAQPWNAIRA